MRYRIGLLLLAPVLVTPSLLADDVLQHHLHGTRDGLYVDPAFTRASAVSMHLDPTFTAPIPGPTYAQPLFIYNGPGGVAALVVATEQNVVMALSAADGSQIWATSLGNPVSRSQLPCGDIDPLGIPARPSLILTPA